MAGQDIKEELVEAAVLKCDMCDFKPARQSKGNLRVHKDAIHLGLKHYCPQCKHPCTTKGNLAQHIAIKHEDRRMFCALCSFSTNQTNKLRAHNISVHLAITYTCPIYNCTHTLPTPATMKYHLIKKPWREDSEVCSV